MRNCIVLANLIAFAVFWAFPVAPPRMLPGFVDVVATAGGLGWHNSLVSHADQLAAMPSMHMGYAVWCALAAWRLARNHSQKVLAGVLGAAYLLLTSFVVIATGNHYLVDVLAGITTTLVALVLVEVVRDFLQRRQSRTIALGLPTGRHVFVPGTVILKQPDLSAPRGANTSPVPSPDHDGNGAVAGRGPQHTQGQAAFTAVTHPGCAKVKLPGDRFADSTSSSFLTR